MLSKLVERGENLGSMVTMLKHLLDDYGSTALRESVEEALSSDSPHPNSVRHILDRKREERNLEPAIPIELPDDPKIKDITVRPHDLGDYDIAEEQEEDE